MEWITVSHMDQVLPVALHEPQASVRLLRRKADKKTASKTTDAA